MQEIPENAILVSFELVGLYPNISHEDGIDIMRVFLNKRISKSILTKSLFR